MPVSSIPSYGLPDLLGSVTFLYKGCLTTAHIVNGRAWHGGSTLHPPHPPPPSCPPLQSMWYMHITFHLTPMQLLIGLPFLVIYCLATRPHLTLSVLHLMSYSTYFIPKILTPSLALLPQNLTFQSLNIFQILKRLDMFSSPHGTVCPQMGCPGVLDNTPHFTFSTRNGLQCSLIFVFIESSCTCDTISFCCIADKVHHHLCSFWQALIKKY